MSGVQIELDSRWDVGTVPASAGPAPDPPIPMPPTIWWDPADEYTDAASIGEWTAREGGLVLTAPGAKPTRGLSPNGRRVTVWDRSAGAILQVWTASINIHCIFVVARYSAAKTFLHYDGLVMCRSDGGAALLQGWANTSKWWGSDGTKVLDGVELSQAGCGDWHVIELYSADPIEAKNGWSVGCDPGTSARAWGGEIGDILVYTSLPTPSERAAIRAWLAARYDIEEHPIPVTPDYWWDPADEYTDDAAVGTWTARTGGLSLTAPAGNPTRSLKGTRRVLAFDRDDSQYLTLPDVIPAMKYAFVAAKYDAATFVDYDGLLGSADAGKIIWTGSSGSSNFYQGAAMLYLDGVQTVAAGCGDWHVYESWVFSGYDIGGLTVGRDRDQAGRYWDGAIGDVIGYALDLDADAAAAVRNWLAARYELG